MIVDDRKKNLEYYFKGRRVCRVVSYPPSFGVSCEELL